MKKIGFILAIAAVAIVALGLRLYRFTPPSTLEGYTIDPVIQLPPGLHSDEAYNALAALRFLQTGEWQPFFAIDQGRAAAHIYLTALVISLAGPVAEASRIASLLAGLLSLAGMAWLTRQLYRAQFPASELNVLTILAIAQLSFTYWFVHFWRIGFEQITLPLLMLPAFAALWRWLQSPTYKWSVIAGSLLGAALYSYPAAYALPVVVVVALGVQFIFQRRSGPAWPQVAAYAAAFAAMAAPLIWFALNHPDQFGGHLQDTAADSFETVWQNVHNTATSLFASGDTQPYYNLPGQALLDTVQSVFLLLGLWMCLRRITRPEFSFPLIWSSIMLIPAVFSIGTPAFGRMAGAVPGVLLLVALGGLQVYQWLTRLHWKWIAPLVLAGALALTAGLTAYHYFEIWPHAKGLLTTFSVAERIQAEVIKEEGPAQVYLSPSDNRRSIFAYLWQDQPLAHSFNGRRCTVLPRYTTQDTRWIVNALEDRRTSDRLSALYPEVISRPLWVETGTTVVARLSLPAGMSAQVPTTTLATIGDFFRLRDYRLIDPPTRGGRLRARLLWEPIGLTPDDWTIATYLIDAAGQIRAQDDRQPCDGSFPTSRWQLTDLISDDRTLTLPQDLPAGSYRLAIVFYRLSDGTRLPIAGLDGEQRDDDVLTLDNFAVP